MANYATNAKELDKKWQDLYANKPIPTENPWEQKSQEYLSQYENRTPFSYNVNKDALYQQYKDQYVQQGKLASMDTMGQAAAMTGGYGNSYAQGAGQQVYQMYLSRLNDIVPQLQEMAYSRHNQEGQDMLTNYSLYKGLSDEIRNQDEIALDNWYRELEFISGERNTAEINAANEKANLINLITSTGYKPSDAELNAAGMTRGQAESYVSAYIASKTPQYKDISAGSDAYNALITDVKKATTLEGLQSVVNRYLSMGYNPDQIDAFTLDKYNELMKTSNEPDTYQPTNQDLTDTPQSTNQGLPSIPIGKRRTSGNISGIWYWENL